jgi:hypothetical protein
MFLNLAACTANKDIEKMADEACACTDKDCATKVADKVAQWITDHKDARGDEDKAKQDFDRMGKCLGEKGADMTKLADAVSKIDPN